MLKNVEQLERRLLAAGMDIDGNGVLEARDVDTLCLGIVHDKLNTPEPYHFESKFEWNGDGIVDIRDLDDYLAEVFNTVRGDTNFDGEVTLADIGHGDTWQAAMKARDTIFGGMGYTEGNLTCDNYDIGPADGDVMLNALGTDRTAPASYFLANEGDLNGDFKFNSEDLVEIFSRGLWQRGIDTEELVDAFIAGYYVES